jgi:hypothetical protein
MKIKPSNRDGFIFIELDNRSRTPEQNFSAEKFCEAVPRPNVSGGEHLSRGRLPLPAHFQGLCGGRILSTRYILSRPFLFDQHPLLISVKKRI